ncbi:hypothetical protein B0T24DRAFT_597906 [Lasiosphaeria ovina]|uniref:Uncharacterized protein n=1 Tax=Lasiosphaeria ovina TaxID=92902 RepID=A0AAE0JXE6_9PEZI|nr:hypothetical protein B0T24DRAFT_597906 [Lasiosphaeria ovina]
MVSRKNPNQPSKNRLASRAGKVRKENARREATAGLDKVAKADTRHGARPGLMPTSGPRKPLSSKKAKKVQQRLALALKRKQEAEGEVEMKDAPAAGKKTKDAVVQMEIS